MVGNAWKRDSPPPGAYPLAAGLGTAYIVDGRAGRLVRQGEWLVCHATEQDGAAVRDAKAAAYATTIAPGGGCVSSINEPLDVR